MTLGDRMKAFEHTYRQYLPRRTYTLLRLDGRAFHTFTRGLHKPFDLSLVEAMNETAITLCKEITGTQFAYVQSDEISLLVTDFENHETQQWLGGNLAKTLSISASVATATFNHHMSTLRDMHAHFDARVWTMSDRAEVANYFVWRQRDCIKNSVSMVAQSYFSHRELEGLNTDQRKIALKDVHDIDWKTDVTTELQRGRVIYKSAAFGGRETIRSRWTVDAAPHFTAREISWLGGAIPQLPTLA